MNKHSLLIKKIKKQFLSINSLLESYFNKLKHFKSNFKKSEIIKNNRVYFGIGGVVILTLFYFLIPTFYNKDNIQSEIKNQILKKYNIDIKFKEKIRYGLLPKPHFSAKNLLVLEDKKEIGAVSDFKIYIGLQNYFSTTNLKMKDLIFNNTIFNIKIDDLTFFQRLLQTEPNENKIIIKNSDIFFKSEDNETLFLNKILNSKFFYDSFNLENIFTSKNKIFNIPYKLIIKNDKFNKEIFANFNANKIRLDIENNINYESDNKKGLLDILFVNKNTSLNYELKKNSLEFTSEENGFFEGLIEFRPFFFKTSINYEGLSTKNLFKDDSIIIELIKSELLNNQNLNVNINLFVKDITNIDELNDLNLNISLDQSNINFLKSKIMWKEDLEIIMNEGLLNYDQDEIYLNGKLIINTINIDNFYKSFQINKSNRKDINKIELDFVYNFNKNKFRFDNVKIDNSSNEKLDSFIDSHNFSGKTFDNKIMFKNFINNFFISYSG